MLPLPATVVSGATHARTRGRTPVVLLDTADLLLHDDHHEMALLDLCEDLAAAGVRLVLTSRPEEANRLRTGFVRMSLGPYDDREIPHSIRGHAALYCPDAVPRDDEARVRRLVEPVARGLPVREVCGSPLQLRLLFELARDDRAFPSAEIDATGLYRRYWDHRVRRGIRPWACPSSRCSRRRRTASPAGTRSWPRPYVTRTSTPFSRGFARCGRGRSMTSVGCWTARCPGGQWQDVCGSRHSRSRV